MLPDATTFTGPAVTTLQCGCVIDDQRAVWTACAAIRGTHGCARYLTSTGQRSEMLQRCLARLDAHLAEQRAVVVGEQGALL